MMKILIVAATVLITLGLTGVTSVLVKGNTTGTTTTTTVTAITSPNVVLVPTVLLKNEDKTETTVTKKSINKLSLPHDRTIFILGAIGYMATAIARQIGDLSNQSDEPIYLVIDSPGGSVIRGALIISAIEASQAPVYTVCYNICASMAAQIHQYGKKRFSVDRAVLMFHWATSGIEGDVNRMLSYSEFVNKYVGKMDANVLVRSGMDQATYDKLTARDMWNDAEDAMALNLVDGLVFLDTESSRLFQNTVNDLGYKKKDYIDSMDFFTMGGLWKPSHKLSGF